LGGRQSAYVRFSCHTGDESWTKSGNFGCFFYFRLLIADATAPYTVLLFTFVAQAHLTAPDDE
jgi:hypothetical protein